MRNERVIVVFAASPSDLEPERAQLEEVIEKLNLEWGRKLGARLELVRWETHAYPGIGQDPQDVLNDQLPQDYDIFVGLMWGRFGTPTGRAGSGTEEEYIRALERHRSDPNGVKMMFYFKDAPIAPSSINPSQLEKVQSFKRSLGSQGTLFWEFDSSKTFEQLINLHLTRQVQEILDGRPHSQPPPIMQSSEASADEEEFGIIDLFELAEQQFAEINEIVTRISDGTVDLSSRFGERTKELELLNSAPDGRLDPRVARLLVEKAAADMNRFAARIRAELPLFRESLHKGIAVSARAVLMLAETTQVERSGVNAGTSAVRGFAETLEKTQHQIATFKSTVSAFPRMTSKLNRAKRDVGEVLDELIRVISEGRGLLLETAKTLDAIAESGHQ